MAIGIFALWDSQNVSQSAEIFAEDAIFDDEVFSDDSSIIGWIRINDTEINQPIVQGEDNGYYLRHNYRGEYATAGSVFMDYRNASDFSDDFMIIYGHRMTGHLMFGDVKLFADASFFEEHSGGTIRVGDKLYELHILGYAVIDAWDDLYEVRSYRNDKNWEIVTRFANTALNWREKYNGGRLVMLSTCDKDSKRYRDVLIIEMGH